MLGSTDIASQLFNAENYNPDISSIIKLLDHKYNPSTGRDEVLYPDYVWKSAVGLWENGGKLKFKSNIILKNNGK